MLATDQTTDAMPQQPSPICYSAPVSDGTVEISLPDTDRADHDAVSSTMLLVQYEEVIQSLENWLGVGLDFEFTQSDYTLPPLFSLERPGTDIPPAEVSIPASLWVHHLSDIDPLLSMPFLIKWQEHQTQLEIAKLTLSEDDLARLRPGSVILLPASFEEQWSAQLQLPAIKYRQRGVLTKNPVGWQGQMEYLAEPTDSGQLTDRQFDQVCCYFRLSTDYLVRSVNNASAVIDEQIIDAVFILNTSFGSKYSGQLIPVSNGYGLRIENAL